MHHKHLFLHTVLSIVFYHARIVGWMKKWNVENWESSEPRSSSRVLNVRSFLLLFRRTAGWEQPPGGEEGIGFKYSSRDAQSIIASRLIVIAVAAKPCHDVSTNGNVIAAIRFSKISSSDEYHRRIAVGLMAQIEVVTRDSILWATVCASSVMIESMIPAFSGETVSPEYRCAILLDVILYFI